MFYNDPKIRGFIYQGVITLLVVAFGYWLVTNAIVNLRAQGKTFGFEFLFQTAGFDIAFKLVPYERASTYFDVFKVGLINTLFVSVISIVFATVLGFILGATVLAYLLSGTQVTFDVPKLTGFNFKGGFTAPPEFTALLVGLSLYHATFIGENVRAGIQAVNYGQTEAAQSLGIKDNDRLRLVIIPQALRVIIPPTTSEYLSLIKNSSLGAAIAFPELVAVYAGTALNQSGRAIEIISMTMLVYLTFSLITSFLMNIYNARVALVER